MGEELEYTIETLNKKHSKAFFNCGISELNHYLLHQARQDMKRHIAITYVLNVPFSNNIIGYHTLSATSVELEKFSEQEKKRLPRYPLLPATLIGRLAVDKGYQGKGIGQLLLIHALKVSLENSKKIASLAVIVDIKNDKAIPFYQRFGFIPFFDAPNKLYLPIKTIKNMGF